MGKGLGIRGRHENRNPEIRIPFPISPFPLFPIALLPFSPFDLMSFSLAETNEPVGASILTKGRGIK